MVWTDHMTPAYVENRPNRPLSLRQRRFATPAVPRCREIPYRSVPGFTGEPQLQYAISVVKQLLRVTGLRPKNHDPAIAYGGSTYYHGFRSARARTPLPVPM